MRHSHVGASVGVVIVAFAVAACSSAGTSSNNAADTVQVCADVSLSGAYAAVDVPVLAGLKATVKDVNAAGGLLGHQVALHYLDDHSDATRVPAIAQELFTKYKCLVVFANNSGTITGALVPFASRAKVISTSAVPTPALSVAKDYPYNFVLNATNPQQAAAFLAAAKRVGAKKVGLLYDNNTATTALMQTVRSALTSGGLDAVDAEGVDSTATNLTVQAVKLKNAGADTVIVQANPVLLLTAQRALASVNWAGVKIISSPNAVNAQTLGSVPSSIAANYYAMGYRGNLSSSVGGGIPQTFANSVASFGKVVNLNLSAQGHDYFAVVFWGAEQAKSLDPSKIAKVLESNGSKPLPNDTLYVEPSPPGYTSTEHSMAKADLSKYWSLLRPGKADQNGQFNGEPLTVG